MIEKQYLVSSINHWLEQNENTELRENKVWLAEFLIDSVLGDIPVEAIEEHVPVDVFYLVQKGLLTIPLAPEYELHCLICEQCKRNYDFALKNMGDITTLRTDGSPDWEKRDREGGLYRDELLDAMKKSMRISVVSGELIIDVFDERLCSAIDEFVKHGGSFSVIAGPMVEKDIEKGSSPFLDLVSNNPNVKLYVTDRRQEPHFAFSDDGIIYLEYPHKPLTKERFYLKKELLKHLGYNLFVAERFSTAFSSPDVRLYRKDADVLLECENSIISISESASVSGLDTFGIYGLRAQKELIQKSGGCPEELDNAFSNCPSESNE